MNEQNLNPNEPAQSSKNVWITVIAVVITAIIVGGGVYAWQQSNLNSTEQSLQQQISNLRSQIEQLQGELANQSPSAQLPIIDQGQNNNQENQSGNIELAREALISYFDLLNRKQYNEATKYHGSGYDYLRDWNPNLDKNDYAGMLKNGCEINGLQCLKIKDILEQEQISPVEFKFIVQFENDDGTLFKRGPCCGATEEQMPTQADFEYAVKLVDGNYLVISQPVYVP